MSRVYKEFMKARAEKYGWYIVENESTVRATADVFRVSKTMVHHYVTVVLRQSNSLLADEVRKVLNVNKAERHIRGGMAIKLKYGSR